jgi:hypothetical protein
LEKKELIDKEKRSLETVWRRAYPVKIAIFLDGRDEVVYITPQKILELAKLIENHPTQHQVFEGIIEAILSSGVDSENPQEVQGLINDPDSPIRVYEIFVQIAEKLNHAYAATGKRRPEIRALGPLGGFWFGPEVDPAEGEKKLLNELKLLRRLVENIGLMPQDAAEHMYRVGAMVSLMDLLWKELFVDEQRWNCSYFSDRQAVLSVFLGILHDLAKQQILICSAPNRLDQKLFSTLRENLDRAERELDAYKKGCSDYGKDTAKPNTIELLENEIQYRRFLLEARHDQVRKYLEELVYMQNQGEVVSEEEIEHVRQVLQLKINEMDFRQIMNHPYGSFISIIGQMPELIREMGIEKKDLSLDFMAMLTGSVLMHHTDRYPSREFIGTILNQMGLDDLEPDARTRFKKIMNQTALIFKVIDIFVARTEKRAYQNSKQFTGGDFRNVHLQSMDEWKEHPWLRQIFEEMFGHISSVDTGKEDRTFAGHCRQIVEELTEVMREVIELSDGFGQIEGDGVTLKYMNMRFLLDTEFMQAVQATVDGDRFNIESLRAYIRNFKQRIQDERKAIEEQKRADTHWNRLASMFGDQK